MKDFFGITERKFLATPVYFATGIFILLLLFPKKAFYFGTIAIVIGDCMAGIVGKRFGKRKIFYSKEKTLEGSFTCLLSTFLSYSLLTNPFSAFFLAIFTTFIESLPIVYENFILPISVGIVSLLM
jgi:dolichol kinase